MLHIVDCDFEHDFTGLVHDDRIQTTSMSFIIFFSLKKRLAVGGSTCDRVIRP